MPKPTETLLKDTLSGQISLVSEMMGLCLEPHVRAQGITLGTFEILSAIQAGGGKAAQAEIAKNLGIRPPSLCESLKSLSANGLVEQFAHPSDQRAKRVRLTPRGSAILRNILKVVREHETAMVAGIDQEQIRQAVATLRQANRNLARALEN